MAELSIGTPSTTMSGWLFPTTVRMPRIWMNDDAPGSPDCALTKTFGAFAARASTTFCSLLLEIWSADTLLRTLPSFSVEVAVPAPVTTISPSCSGLGSNAKSFSITPALSVTCKVVGLYPSRRAVTVSVWPGVARALGMTMA